MEIIDFIRNYYDYFKGNPGMDKFKDIPIPKTEYQNNLNELSQSPIEQWVESFTREHVNDHNKKIELLGSEIYELFQRWCGTNGVRYEITCVKLGVRLTNLNIIGITKGKHTMKGDTKIFNIY